MLWKRFVIVGFLFRRRFVEETFCEETLCMCVVSMSPCHHVSMSPCHHVTLSPCHHVSMSLCLHVSILHVSMFPEFRKRKTELTENINFRVFVANRKQKWQTYVLFSENENGKRKFAFLWSANDKWQSTFAVLSICAHLW